MHAAWSRIAARCRDRHTTYAHNDPNSATPDRNEFLKRLLPFLTRIAK